MVEFSGNTHKVTIMREGSACKVDKEPIKVDGGDKIIFQNNTDGAVFIQSSVDYPFLDVNIEIESGKPGEMLVGKMKEDECPCKVPYAVFCMCIPGFATASSMPIIIIVRP